MRVLLATTCLTPIVLLATPAAAQTSISTATTAPVKTSTTGDLTITADGSVTVTSPTAVTIDSNNKVSNQGTIQITNVDGANGILATAGGSGTIGNSGKIILNETYTPTDTDNDGDLDGPFAAGSNRAGIRTAGAFTGPITTDIGSSIAVNGNDSYGIVLGGPLTGNLSSDGTITVVGDRSVGIQTGDVTGSVRAAGTISAQGAGASAVVVGGNVTGTVTLQGSIASTGYRYTTPPTDTSTLDADDLLQGGPAVSITGNVAGGVIVAVPPAGTTTDTAATTDADNDGIPDVKEGSGAIVSLGAAAAIQIGSATNAVTLGAVPNTAGYGLIIDGTVNGSGVYSGVAGNAIVIGGLGGDVTIAKGISNTGTIQATAVSANATALRIGSGATVPEILNSGTIAAGGGSAAGQVARAIVIDAGANVGTITNSGAIKAAAGGTSAGATAIVDLSGGLTTISNSGAIGASGGATGQNVAIDVSANTTGVTINQTVVTADVTAPTIIGDVRFGSGNDVFNIADGTVTGNVSFGTGDNKLALSGDAALTGNVTFGGGADTMTLGGTSAYTGTADFGGGGDTLTLNDTAIFAGTLANAQNLAVNVNGGTFTSTGAGAVSIGALSVGATGTLGVTIDTTNNTATHYQVGGAANFTKGATIAVSLDGLISGPANYVVVTAGSITGAADLVTNDVALPYMYKSSIDTGTANQVAISIDRKTTTELGLNRSGTSAYNAIYAALSKDQDVAGSFLNITDAATFQTAVRQMLPDHAGGTFEATTSGSRALGRMLTDGGAPFKDEGHWGYWIQELAFSRNKSYGDTAGYSVNGWGTAGGAEYKTKLGNFGLSIAYLHGNDDDKGTDNTVSSDQYELAAYWRGEWGGLRPFARVSGARVNFQSTREFDGTTGDNEAVTKKASGAWNGTLYSATGGASYEGAVGQMTFRPILSFDYYRLEENAHSETGGGEAFDLNIAKRTSDELAGNATVAVGRAFGSQDSGWFHIEVEGGRRQIISGSLGATTANFEGGEQFTLTPEKRTSGWVGRLRMSGGAPGFRVGGEVGAEEQQGRAALSLRATLLIGL